MSSKSRKDQFDLEYFFDMSADLLCIAGFDGYFKKINPAVSKILGFETEELLAAPIASFIHPHDRELSQRKREGLRNGDTVYQFENRYVARDGSTVWLFWTAVPIVREKLIFAIAKDITGKKMAEGSERVSEIIAKLNTEQMKRFSAEIELIEPALSLDRSNLKWMGTNSPITNKDQLWLNRFEECVRRLTAKKEISLKLLSAEMALSERQLFRQISRIMDTTPNRLVRIIRLHLAWEAIASRQHRTLLHVAEIAGYTSTAHFKKLFQKVYGIDVQELL